MTKHPTTPWPRLSPALAAHPRRPRLPERLPDYGVLHLTLTIANVETPCRVLFRLDNMKALEVQRFHDGAYHRVRQPELAHARNQIKDQNIHANYPGMTRHRDMPHWAQ